MPVWLRSGRIAAAAGAMGDPDTGPIVLLTRVDGGGPAFGRFRLASDLVRLVVRGSCAIDGHAYVAGDMRAQIAGTPVGEAVAGPDGLDEVIVVADRRHLVPSATDDPEWADALTTVLADLHGRLAGR